MGGKTLASLGMMVRERRGAKKLRETAAEIGIGVATLMRVESGRIPDLDTFGSICNWLGEDPGSFLGFEPRASARQALAAAEQPLLVSAHLRADQAPQLETARALARMILLAAQFQRGSTPASPDDDV